MTKSLIKIKTFKIDHVLKNPSLLRTLRNLTIQDPGHSSGMNSALSFFERLQRPIAAKAIIAYFDQNPIGWALIANEQIPGIRAGSSSFEDQKYSAIQVFVHPDFRRMGVGKKLIQTARRHVLFEPTICPWDEISRAFYAKFKKLNHATYSAFLINSKIEKLLEQDNHVRS